jgi:hypothetical protein
LFAVFYRSVEGVLDLIAFSGVRDGAHFTDHKGCEAQCRQSPNYKSMSASYAHDGPRFPREQLARQ